MALSKASTFFSEDLISDKLSTVVSADHPKLYELQSLIKVLYLF